MKPSRSFRKFPAFFAVSLALVTLWAAGCGGEAQQAAPAKKAETAKAAATAKPAEPRRIKVGLDAAYRPMEFIDVDTNELVGFDVDLMRAICKEAGLSEPDFQNTPWDGLLASLGQGSLDAAISSITITEERKQTLDFTEPYYRSAQALVVRVEDKDKIKGIDDLRGKVVAVQIATTGQFLLEKEEGVELRQFDTAPLIIQDLRNKNVDAAMIDLPVARFYAKASGSQSGADLFVGENVFSEEHYGIAVRKGNDDLLKQLNEGLRLAKEKGIVDRLEKKWF
jgi:ABC-type amino acid transport substrate-binding protein